MVTIEELEEALAPKKKGSKKTTKSKKATKASKKVKSSPQNDIIYVDSKGNEVEPEDIKEGKTYYIKKGGEDNVKNTGSKRAGHSKRGTGPEN